MLSIVGLAVVLFASTNVDDLFVLVGFLADPRYETRQVVFGQYLGVATLVAVSLAASLAFIFLAPAFVGLLGVLPIGIGTKKLIDEWRRQGAEEEALKARPGSSLAVAAVTIANGGDNIGTYTPVFATSPATEIAILVSVFAVMVAIWLWFSHWLVNHRTLGAPLRRYGHIVTPVMLIGIGFYILYRSGSLSLLP